MRRLRCAACWARRRRGRAARAEFAGRRVGLRQGVPRHRLGLVGRHLRRPLRARARASSPARGTRSRSSNGTAALHVCLLLAGVRPGDEVLVPALTFVATANAVALRRRDAAFRRLREADRSASMPRGSRDYLRRRSPSSATACAVNRADRAAGSRALVPMHVFGHPVDLDALREVAARWRPGADRGRRRVARQPYYTGRHTGTLRRRLAALSFNGNKIVTTGGGGAILTNDAELGAARQAPDHDRASCRTAGTSCTTRSATTTACPTSTPRSAARSWSGLPACSRASAALAERYREGVRGVSRRALLRRAGRRTSNYWLNAIVLDARRTRAERDACSTRQRRRAHDAPGLDADAPAADVSRLPAHAICRGRGAGARASSTCRAAPKLGRRERHGPAHLRGHRQPRRYGLLTGCCSDLRADPALELQLVVTGMHLAPEFGLTVERDRGRRLRRSPRASRCCLSSDTPRRRSRSRSASA